MAERIQHLRRPRTSFTPEQLQLLTEEFRKNRSPHWETIQELASLLGLDDIVVKTWFKNQRVKWKKQQQQRQPSPSPGPSILDFPIKDEESPLPVIPTNVDSSGSGSSGDPNYDPLQPCGFAQPGGAGVPVLDSSRESLPHDIQETCLGASGPPWANLPSDIEELIRLYDLPGEEDACSLDRYLSPVGLR